MAVVVAQTETRAYCRRLRRTANGWRTPKYDPSFLPILIRVRTARTGLRDRRKRSVHHCIFSHPANAEAMQEIVRGY